MSINVLSAYRCLIRRFMRISLILKLYANIFLLFPSDSFFLFYYSPYSFLCVPFYNKISHAEYQIPLVYETTLTVLPKENSYNFNNFTIPFLYTSIIVVTVQSVGTIISPSKIYYLRWNNISSSLTYVLYYLQDDIILFRCFLILQFYNIPYCFIP